MAYFSDIKAFWKNPVDVHLSAEDIPWPCARNIVATADLRHKIDMQQCVRSIGSTSFRASPLSADTIRTMTCGETILPTAQVFNSVIVLMGSNSISTSLYVLHFLRFMLCNFVVDRRMRSNATRLFINNFVSSTSYKPLDVKNYEANDTTSVVKHKKSFSGVTHKPTLPGRPGTITLVVFETGKVNVMKLDPIRERDMFIHVVPILERNVLQTTTLPIANESVNRLRQILQQSSIPSNISLCDFVKATFKTIRNEIEEKNKRQKRQRIK